MGLSKKDLDKIIKEYQGDYLIALAKDVMSVRRILDNLNADTASASKLEEIRLVFHRHAGTGGTMGLPEVSLVAKELECLFDGKLNPDTVIAQKNSILEGIAKLEQFSKQ